MTDGSRQRTLADEFDGADDGGDSGGDGDGRPAEEAAVVAGDGALSADAVEDRDHRFPDHGGDHLELLVTQVDYSIEGAGSDEYPVVHLFGRTDDDDTEHVRVLGFEPYFYVPAAVAAETDLIGEYDAVVDVRHTTPDGEPFESIRGTEVSKIVARTPRDVGRIRDDFETTYEADILFPNRLLIDRDVEGGVRVPARRLDDREDGAVQVPPAEVVPCEAPQADLRVNTFDIEVDDRSGFPEDGEEPIVCLTSHDSYDDEYVLWLYEAPAGDGSTPEDADFVDYDPAVGDDLDVRVESFAEEAAMLDAFVDYLARTDPDVLTGWNFEDFDAPYLLDRMAELDVGPEHDLTADRLSRIGETWRSGWGGPNVKGRVVMDLLYAYQRTMFTELESYRLDAVGERELDVGKERYPGDIGDLWEDDPHQLLAYNLRDVELCVEIDRKQEVIAFWNEARKFVGCKLEDAPTPGDAVDMYVLHEAFGEFVLPTKGAHDAEEFEGGAVFDPVSGIKENVTVLDLKSLYPMSMVTINASPETKVDPETYDGETYRTPNGVHFRTEPDGIIREMVTELLDGREAKKAARDEHDPGSERYEQYDRQQAALKVIMNSLYGVFGWDRFRLYDKEMSSGVTATNREVIRFTETAADEAGHEVAYGDTDSVMLELGADVSEEAAIEQAFDIEDHINDRYDDFVRAELDAEDHRFQIEFEKLYRRFFQAGKKKRYAGHIVWKEGKTVDDIDITGFEYQRSDIAAITKRVQREIIEMIVTGGDLDEVERYLHEEIEAFQAGDVDLDEIGIPGGIGKRLSAYETPTAQVRGAQYANDLLDTNFQRGSKPKRLYLEKVHPEFWQRMEAEKGLDPQRDALYGEFKRDPDVICYDYADQVPAAFDVDYEKMLEKTLKGPIERIIEALGLSWDEVKSGQEQTGLGQWA